ncbi:apoptosis facilitator Bcl-2-like protein 14 [Callorhinus ursinus]|uniref:Apoptosis facilitator Bcl-2-like protein 14 n=1 Tax=Callorhinus ursinus TaxID=34884 RepID=A0A3Q7R5W0_CALUR|nr:apoptosis facilitator Bcl-2-like protein 14 [Callorhinus ursinus]XP_025735757.1 apoptosis facilitator Bcl-2-like protein 14 [Callorhinus ursinus]
MCTTSSCDLEEIPLDDDDTSSIEFKILAFYAKHHVFKNSPAVFSPKLLRTRSWSQKGLRGWSANESRTQVSWPCRDSPSSEKPLNLAKKKSSWRTLFGVIEKEEDAPSSPVPVLQGAIAYQAGPQSQQWSRSLTNVEQHAEREAVDPKVVSIAHRVAEIVYSWPPPEEFHDQGGSSKSKGNFVHHFPHRQGQCSQPRATSTKKDGEDQIIAKIVELLKYSGDHLERELKKDKTLMNSFQNQLSYPVFKTITDHFLRGVDTRGESEVTARGFKAALAIDATAKLTAIDNHPMNRVLGFGTKYLKDNFSPWVQQQGGWEKVFGIAHEEVD